MELRPAPAQINTPLARHVDTPKPICSHGINFIHIQERITVSTGPSRVGSCHESGQVVARTETAVTIDADDLDRNLRHGINMPIRFHGNPVAVIGLTGAP